MFIFLLLLDFFRQLMAMSYSYATFVKLFLIEQAGEFLSGVPVNSIDDKIGDFF